MFISPEEKPDSDVLYYTFDFSARGNDPPGKKATGKSTLIVLQIRDRPSLLAPSIISRIARLLSILERDRTVALRVPSALAFPPLSVRARPAETARGHEFKKPTRSAWR